MATIQTDTLDIDISKLLEKFKKGKISAEDFEKAILKAQKQTDKNATSNKNLAGTLGKVTDQLKKGKGAGDSFLVSMIKFNVLGGIFRGVKNAVGSAVGGLVSYNKEMAKLIAITNASIPEQKELRATAEVLGETTAFTASQVVVLMQEYAKLGFTVDQINKMATATVDLAVFTGDVALTAETAGGAIKAFGLEAKDSQRVIDVMAKSFNTTALNLTRYYEAAKDGFPILDAFGASIEDGTAIMGALAESMVTGSRAGTGVKTIFSDIRDESSKVAQVLGGTAQNMDEFVELLETANARGKDFSDEALVDLDKRSKAVILGLVKQVDKLKELRVAYKDVDGTAKKMADDAINSLEGAFTLLNSAISGLVNKEGTGTYQFLHEIVKKSIPLVKWLGENFKTVATVALTAVLIPALKATWVWVSTLGKSITFATGGLNLLFGAIATAISSGLMSKLTENQHNYNKTLDEFNKKGKLAKTTLRDITEDQLRLNKAKAEEDLSEIKRKISITPTGTKHGQKAYAKLREEELKLEKYIAIMKEGINKKYWESYEAMQKKAEVNFQTRKAKKEEADKKEKEDELRRELNHQKKIMKTRQGLDVSSTELRTVDYKEAKSPVFEGPQNDPQIFIDAQAKELELVTGLDELKKEIDENELDRKKKLNEAITEDLKESQEEQLASIQENLEIIGGLQSSISGIFSQLSTNRMIEIDNEYKKKKDNILKNIKDETKQKTALEKLDKEYEDKKREEQKKTAEMNKLTALFNIAIDTASAMVKVFPNPYLMAAAAVLGTTQAGVVAAQPIPEYAIGGVGISGEGSGTSDSILARISNGESVVTARGTASGDNSQILRNMNSGATFTNDNGALIKEIRGLKQVMAEQKAPNISVNPSLNRDGFTTSINETNANFANNNNRDEQADI